MLVPAPPHVVPAGPLAVRWLAYELPPLRAGCLARARLELENAGSATWRSNGREGIQASYHWLDPLGNPIVWDGVRTALPHPVEVGERVELVAPLEAPMPPGPYRLAFDLLHEHRFWFSELGNDPLDLDAAVAGRLLRRALAVRIAPGPPDLVAVTEAALAAQEEPVSADAEATAHVAAGCLPAPDWSVRILDAHDEGFAAVGGAVEVEGGWLARRRLPELAAWAPGFGRRPDPAEPLLCPSLLVDAPLGDVAGLPAVDPAAVAGRSLADGRIRVRLRGGRRRA